MIVMKYTTHSAAKCTENPSKKTLVLSTAAVVGAAATAGVVAYKLYRRAHPKAPKVDTAKRRIACIGDSITYGFGVEKTRKTDAYPAILQTLAGPEWQVLNYGISGRTLRKGGDTPYAKTGYLEAALAANPEIVVVLLGTNDSKPYNWDAPSYEQEYEDLLRHVQETLPEAEIYVLTPPAAFGQGLDGMAIYHIQPEVVRDEIRPILFRLCGKLGLPLIDLYPLTKDHPEYFADGVHPNREGNEVLAETVWAAIDPAEV
jgi:lysophospholipase L1-like esterase